MRNILLTTVTTLLLASCGVYKPYSRPEEVKTDGLYGTDIQAEDTASIASLHWSEAVHRHTPAILTGRNWRITTTSTSPV